MKEVAGLNYFNKRFGMPRAAVFPAFEIIDGDRSRSLVLVADHARNAMPSEYGTLGLPESELQRHIGYDIGTENLTRHLASLLNAPAVLCSFSRLLIDPNRGEDDPTLIRQIYDGTIVPGNYPLSDNERQFRLQNFYQPYHDAVASMIASVTEQSGKPPLIVSIHSFTPTFQGRERPWHVGLLWDKDDRAKNPLFEMLSAQADLVVGDNEPYDGALRGDTLYKHATKNGLAHVLIEVRQDLVRDAAGQHGWADRLAPILETINADDDMHVIRHYGSRT